MDLINIIIYILIITILLIIFIMLYINKFFNKNDHVIKINKIKNSLDENNIKIKNIENKLSILEKSDNEIKNVENELTLFKKSTEDNINKINKDLNTHYIKIINIDNDLSIFEKITEDGINQVMGDLEINNNIIKRTNLINKNSLSCIFINDFNIQYSNIILENITDVMSILKKIDCIEYSIKYFENMQIKTVPNDYNFFDNNIIQNVKNKFNIKTDIVYIVKYINNNIFLVDIIIFMFEDYIYLFMEKINKSDENNLAFRMHYKSKLSNILKTSFYFIILKTKTKLIKNDFTSDIKKYISNQINVDKYKYENILLFTFTSFDNDDEKIKFGEFLYEGIKNYYNVQIFNKTKDLFFYCGTLEIKNQYLIIQNDIDMDKYRQYVFIYSNNY